MGSTFASDRRLLRAYPIPWLVQMSCSKEEGTVYSTDQMKKSKSKQGSNKNGNADGCGQNQNCSSGTTNSLVEEALRLANAQDALLTIPKDPTYIYPVTAFPPESTFDITVTYPALVIPARRIPEIRKELAHVLLERAKLKIIYPLKDNDPVPPGTEDRKLFRKMLLVDREDVFEDPLVRKFLDPPAIAGNPKVSSADASACFQATHQVKLSYADWTVEQILRRLLPVAEVPSAFEIIGHLAHINLRDELLPFKHLVGKAILDKNSPRIQTVVNKVGTIETEYRTFGMEVIAGNQKEGWSQVSVREEGCVYQLDFTQVYWNSRLGGEHRRLVKLILEDAASRFKHGEQAKQNASSGGPLVVADLMAGIGPFAVPLTANNRDSKNDDSGNLCEIQVYANDLNPASYKYLRMNSIKNKCKNLQCFNMDGRAFCHKLQDEGIHFHHVLMNLPATAPEFLDAFRGFTGASSPRIHVHCFSSKDPKESERDTIARCELALGCPLKIEETNLVIHTVRNIAPNKNMYCLSFDLPKEVRNLPRISTKKEDKEIENGEQASKRPKLS